MARPLSSAAMLGRACLYLAGLLMLPATSARAQEAVHYHWFEYRGHDAAFAQPLPQGHYRNPVLAAFQSETHWYFLGVHRVGARVELFLRKDAGGQPTTVAHAWIEPGRIKPGATLKLKIAGDGGAYSFAWDADGKGWRWLRRGDDATILSTDVAGGFVGTVLGPYARTEAVR
jgi:alpha-N-arabinofuranosidase